MSVFVLAAGAPGWIEFVYMLSALLFILGMKRLSGVRTARSGNALASLGMLLAIVATLLVVGDVNYVTLIGGLLVGTAVGAVLATRVQMTGMPELVAFFNGLGGAASAFVALAEMARFASEVPESGGQAMAATSGNDFAIAIFLSVLIGTVTLSGSLIAFAKLQGIMRGVIRFGGLQLLNMLLLGACLVIGGMLVAGALSGPIWLGAFFGAAFALGIMMTVPIGGADMPVVISLYNALTGLAVAFEGFVLNNAAMIIAGTVVGSAGTLLTQLMAKAMNRSLANVLFSGFGSATKAASGTQVDGEVKPITAEDAYYVLEAAGSVVFVPGYGMAVAQAQHAVREPNPSAPSGP